MSLQVVTTNFIEYRGKLMFFPAEYSHRLMWLIAKNKNVENVEALALLYENTKIYGCVYGNHIAELDKLEPIGLISNQKGS